MYLAPSGNTFSHDLDSLWSTFKNNFIYTRNSATSGLTRERGQGMRQSKCQGDHSDILVYICMKKKLWKWVFFNSRTHKGGTLFKGPKCHFSGKGGGFVKIYSKFFQLKPIQEVKFWTKSLVRGDFCIMTKMHLEVYFKTIVHACVHLHIWVVPWVKMSD